MLNTNIDGVTWNFCELEIQVHESASHEKFDPCASLVVSSKMDVDRKNGI